MASSKIQNHVTSLFKSFHLSSVPRKPKLLGLAYKTCQNLAFASSPHFPSVHLYPTYTKCPELPGWAASTAWSSPHTLCFPPRPLLLASPPSPLSSCTSICLTPIAYPLMVQSAVTPYGGGFTELPFGVSIQFHHIFSR